MQRVREAHLRVFLSYRREDCSMHAGRLADNLRDRGVAEVFIDVDEILPGQNFVKRIEEEIENCDAVLVMIGDDWLTLTGSDGQPRIRDERDWVYLEVKAALERDVPVIPVLVEGAEMPQRGDLPPAIGELAFRMALQMRDSSWGQDYLRLASALPESVARTGGGGGEPPPAPRRERARLDFVAAQSFIESIPAGHWASYKDVATAAGAPSGAQAVGNWLRTRGEDIPNVWRVLDSSGKISDGFRPSNPDLPSDPDAVRKRLSAEGVSFDSADRADSQVRWTAEDAAEDGAGITASTDVTDRRSSATSDTLIVAGRRAYPDYLLSSSYICQQGRSFRNNVQYLGFYSDRLIRPEIPRIVDRRDNVKLTFETIENLLGRSEGNDLTFAMLIERILDPQEPWTIRRGVGDVHQIFLLTDPNSEETIHLPHAIRHEGPSAWVQSQRYVDLANLRTAEDTEEL